MNKKLTALAIGLTMAVVATANPYANWGYTQTVQVSQPAQGTVVTGTVYNGGCYANPAVTTTVQQVQPTVTQQQVVAQPQVQVARPAYEVAGIEVAPCGAPGGTGYERAAVIDAAPYIPLVHGRPNTVIAPNGVVVNPYDQPTPGHTKMWVNGSWVIRNNGDASGPCQIWVPGHYEYQ